MQTIQNEIKKKIHTYLNWNKIYEELITIFVVEECLKKIGTALNASISLFLEELLFLCARNILCRIQII